MSYIVYNTNTSYRYNGYTMYMDHVDCDAMLPITIDQGGGLMTDSTTKVFLDSIYIYIYIYIYASDTSSRTWV